MKLKLISYHGLLFLVFKVGRDVTIDPPEVYYAVPLQDSIAYSIMRTTYAKIPVSQALEISDKNKAKAMLVLYG